ncbi:MAG: alanine racemase [Candidatus Methylomirabilota bacterium]
MDPRYRIGNAEALDTPALVFYEARIRENIERMGRLLGGFSRLRPHVKTHKCREILDMQLAAGITRVKCATPKEVRFAAEAGVRDILLAYPVVGPLARRAASLQKEFPQATLTVLVDHPAQLRPLADACLVERVELGAMVDVNSGMNRTGIGAGPEAAALAELVRKTNGLRFAGLHSYGSPPAPGGIEARAVVYRAALQTVVDTRWALERAKIPVPCVVAGNSLDFELAARTEGIDEVSPGTWILWDKGYGSALPGQFAYAALVLGRVISRPGPALFAVDAGYKALSADPPIPHAEVLSVPGSEVVGRWEEHLLVRLASPSDEPAVGSIVYLVPVHVCSTVNLWDEALVVGGQGEVTGTWRIAARGH